MLVALAALAGGCASDGDIVVTEQPRGGSNERALQRRERPGSVFDMFGGGGQIGNTQYGSGRGEGFVGNVNRHLWQASLETLAFLPIASTDPYSGVIATDWGVAPESPDERFRVTAFVTDVALEPNSLRVAVFREKRNGDGWVTAPVAAETPRQIEDSILVRARQLRLAERGAG
jgi:hypothetical protein